MLSLSVVNDRILTLHPDGKQGVNIEKKKYDLLKIQILAHLKQRTYGFQELGTKLKRDFPNFEGSISWYYTVVKLDLEARGLLIVDRSHSPQILRLSSNQ